MSIVKTEENRSTPDSGWPRRVAVTGATGLVGSHLTARLLAEGAPEIVLLVRDRARLDVVRHVLTREGQAWDDTRLQVVEAALNNPLELREALQGVGTVFHCAAQVSLVGDRADELIETNVEMTAHVVDAAIDSGVELLVHVSSIAALGTLSGGGKADGLIDESVEMTSLAGVSPYGVAKFLSENEVWRGAAMGLRVVVVNPSVILGCAGRTTGSGAIVPVLTRGVPYYTDGVVGYVDVRDVARAMTALARCGKAAGQRFVLSAENLSYRELLSLGAEAAGKRPPRWRVHKAWVAAAAGIARLLGFRVWSRPLVKALYTQHRYSGGKIKRYIDFEYTPVRETIRRLVGECGRQDARK